MPAATPDKVNIKVNTGTLRPKSLSKYMPVKTPARTKANNIKGKSYNFLYLVSLS